MKQGAGAPDIMRVKVGQFPVEILILTNLKVGGCYLVNDDLQLRRDETAAVFTKIATAVGKCVVKAVFHF